MGTQTVNRTTVQNLGPVSDDPAHVGETETQALHRLAAQAKARGVKIVQNIVTNHHWATSASQPGKLHAVTLFSCDCPGFTRWGRCHHYAAILEYYRSLPPIVADTGPDSGPDGGGAAMPVPAAADDDVVISIVPAPSTRCRVAIRAENPHTVAKPSPWSSRETMDFFYADAVEIDGRMHRVGDRVRYAYRKGEAAVEVGTIGAIYRTTANGRRWKVTFRENDFGRYVADVRALTVEGVRHAA